MTRLQRFISLIAFTLVLPTAVFAQPTLTQKEEFDPDIVESVFSYQITQCAENTSLRVFLLSLQQRDPSDELMKRFADGSVSVKRGSALAVSEGTNEFIDKESGKFAALLSIDKLKILPDGSAEVEGSCGYADWAARSYRYSLVREKKRWIVKRADLTSVL